MSLRFAQQNMDRQLGSPEYADEPTLSRREREANREAEDYCAEDARQDKYDQWKDHP